MLVGERFKPFEDIPAVVLAAVHDVHFLHSILPDVGEPEIAGDGIEAEAPGVAETAGPDFRPSVRPAAKRVVGGNGVGPVAFRAVHVDAHHFAEQQLQVLCVPIGIVVRAGIAHRDVEKSIRPELQAAAAVILSHADDLQDQTRRLAGVALEIRRECFLDDMRRNFPLLEDLIEQVILPVLAKLRMECQIEQPVRSAVAEHFFGQIGEDGFLLARRCLLHHPDHSLLMQHKENVAQARHLMKCSQPTVLFPARQPELLGQKRPRRHRLRDLGNDAGHAMIAGQRGLGLLQCRQVFREIRELLKRQTRLQTFRHERQRAAALLLDVGGGEGHQLAVGSHQLHDGVIRVLQDALNFFARFCLHQHRAISRRNHCRGHEHRVHEIAASELISGREQIRPGLARPAIDGMAL